jgi:hypothetical protein
MGQAAPQPTQTAFEQLDVSSPNVVVPLVDAFAAAGYVQRRFGQTLHELARLLSTVVFFSDPFYKPMSLLFLKHMHVCVLQPVHVCILKHVHVCVLKHVQRLRSTCTFAMGNV